MEIHRQIEEEAALSWISTKSWFVPSTIVVHKIAVKYIATLLIAAALDFSTVRYSIDNHIHLIHMQWQINKYRSVFILKCTLKNI